MKSERSLGLFDIDKTLYNGYIVFPLVKVHEREGLIVPEATQAIDRSFASYRSGEISYEAFARMLLIHWADGLSGMPYSQVLESTRDFVRTQETNFFPFARPFLERLQNTHDIYLVTAEADFVGQAVTEQLGATGHISTIFETENGIFTGSMARSLAGREEKRTAIEPLIDRYPQLRSIAGGDSDGDIDMLSAVENPFCVVPAEALRIHAEQRGWAIASEVGKVDEMLMSMGF